MLIEKFTKLYLRRRTLHLTNEHLNINKRRRGLRPRPTIYEQHFCHSQPPPFEGEHGNIKRLFLRNVHWLQ
jgi:hypothetical protein